MIKILFILIFVAFLGCDSEKEIEWVPTKRFHKEYPDYYIYKYEFETHNNYSSLDKNYVYGLFLDSSIKKIKLITKNLEFPSFKRYDPLVVKKIYHGANEGYLFFKNLRVKYNLRNSWTQLEYPLDKYGRTKVKIVFSESEGNERECIFFEWTSVMASDFEWLVGDESSPTYMWGINKSTDTIRSNVPLKYIKEYYKDFEGIYEYKEYSEIIVDYNFLENGEEFYHNITFKN